MIILCKVLPKILFFGMSIAPHFCCVIPGE